MRQRKKQDNFVLMEPEKRDKTFFWKNKYLIVSILFSICWIFFMGQYLVFSGWWQNRFDMTPAELIGGLGGLAMPMVVFWLVCAYFDRTDQLESEAQTLKSYLNELVYPTEEGAIYTRTLTEALRTQIKEFRSVFQEVNEETGAVRDDLKRWVRDLSAIIKHANTKTIASIREIARHIQNMAAATELANQQSGKTANLFSEQAAILERVVDGTVRSTQALSQTLNNNTSDMQNLIRTLSVMNTQTKESVSKSEQVITELSKSGEQIEKSINLYENSARQQNARLFGNLEKVLSVFRAHGDLLEQEVERTTQKLGQAENALKTQAQEVIKLTDTAVQKVDESALAFGTARGELDEALNEFKAEATLIARQIEKAGGKASGSAVVQQIRTGDMLEEATAILTRLQEFSIDMAHLFMPKTEESLWEHYYAGDKTVFMRHIRSELSAAKNKKLKELYQSNPEFKESVDRYMGAFERLTQALGKGDDSKLLMSIVIGSDAGRLYMVLAEVLKGKKHAR